MIPKAKYVTWRDGIHLTGTSIWCDAIRARDICFLSTASVMRGVKHAQLIASQDTLTLLGESPRQTSSRLAVPFGQPFTLGTHRIELFSSGHALGASSLLVNVADRRLLYAGAINPRGSLLGGALDQRATDVLVISARYGQAHFAFPDPTEVFARLSDRCSEVCAGGGVATLLVEDVGKALDLAAMMSDLALPIHLYRPFFDAAQRLNLPSLGALRRGDPTSKQPRILLWPIHLQSKLGTDRPSPSRILLVSGRALVMKTIKAVGADEGFVLSNHADHLELVRYIKNSGAKHVYLTHSSDRGRDLAQALPNLHWEAIGPPEQLSLFGRERGLSQ